MVNMFIGTIQNKTGSILKYRILDVNNKSIREIHSRSIESELGSIQVRNLILKGSNIKCTEGNVREYPIIIQNDRKIKNNNPIIIELDNVNVTIANVEGNLVTLPVSALIQKISLFANAAIVNNVLKIKDTSKESTIPKTIGGNVGSSGSSGSVGSVGNVGSSGHVESRQGGNVGKTALDIIMESTCKNITIPGFHMADHYKEFGVSDDLFKKPSVLFAPCSETRKKVDNNPNEYSFDIVKFEDRVELRKYNGNGYTGAVVVPDNVTHICKESFVNAEATELTIPESVVYLGESAFIQSKFKVMHLSSKITAIPSWCFKDSDIEEINLDNITSIDNMAFCKSSIKVVNIKANIKQIGYEAFNGCKNLEEFNHNNTVEKIRHHAFFDCIRLVTFNFDSVLKIEQYAFHGTGINRVKINGEVGYLQSDTFTGEITEIEILDGMTKISANSVSNINNLPIKWTVPKSATNIEKGTFKEIDTVYCYRKSVAASSAIQEKANIVYIDDIGTNLIPNKLRKAAMLDISIEEILNDVLKSILDSESQENQYEIDETRLVRADIPSDILSLIGNGFECGKYATEEDFDTENVKFKCILEHLSKVAVLDILPFSKLITKMRDTLNINNNSGKLEILYTDEISSVYRIVYVDNKFTSVNSSFIVAKTRDTLRYICVDNKYTDIMSETNDIKDLSELLNILRPGDTIGLNNIISDVRYNDIVCESSKTISVKRGNLTANRKLKMNMYQALRFSSVTIKLDSNNIALLIPGNDKIIKCASLGKTVWQNEKEDTYKSIQCTIDSIEDIKNNTVFDYNSTYKNGNYGGLLKRLKGLRESEHQEYIGLYSHIYKAEQSAYKHAGNYAYTKGIKSIEDTNIDFMLKIFKTYLIEERKDDWLEASIGTTIVADGQHKFELADGSTLYQYRNVKKIALRNKLMSGGDNKLYIFELVDDSGIRIGVYISLYDIVKLVNMCLEINTESKLNTNKQIFIDTKQFDIVDGSDVIEISLMCKASKLNIEGETAQYMLGVYKPNGLNYIGLRIEYGKTFKFIPLIQIGELEVALEFIEDTNKYGLNNESMRYIYDGSIGAISKYIETNKHRYMSSGYKVTTYLGLLKARELCINGISDITEYNKLGLKEILKRCLGYSGSDDLYTKKEIVDLEFEVEDDVDEEDEEYTDDLEFDIEEEDLE